MSANLEGQQKILFRLTYNNLLEGKAGVCKQAINIDLKQVEVFINKSLPIIKIQYEGNNKMVKVAFASSLAEQ